ncbi:MAG: glycosyltransferase family 1 protein, partial [Acidimicrobiia bacterium]
MPFLVLAYACEPDEGSEPGVGWSWSRMLATIDMTYVVTRSNNAPSIEAALETLPAKERPHFIYVDLPAWARFWKKGARGLRLYYVLWQIAAFWRVRRLPARVGSTIWHLTLANAGLGSTAALLGRPFIYGPVGGGVAPAWRLSSVLGVKGTIAEVAR